MEETSELVDLALDLDVRPGIFLEEGVVLRNLVLQGSQLQAVIFNHLFLSQDFQELAGPQVLSHRLNLLLHVGGEGIQVFKGLNGKVLGRRAV